MKKKKPKKSPAKSPTKSPPKSSQIKAIPSVTESSQSDLEVVSDAPVDGSAVTVAQPPCESSDPGSIEAEISTKEIVIADEAADPPPSLVEASPSIQELSSSGAPHSSSVSLLDVLAISPDELEAIVPVHVTDTEAEAQTEESIQAPKKG
ncbi:hypothetical protein Rs2_47109 [Raphanus sativus]|nr:hypothetical protein Rs2_47109 [Raphanus sativus]